MIDHSLTRSNSSASTQNSIQINVPASRFTCAVSIQEQKKDSSAIQSEVSFRRYEQGDISVLARLARDAWPADASLGSAEQELSVMESYIEYSLSVANWTDIACTPEGIVGFLFGGIDNYPDKALRRKSALGELPAAIRWFLRRGQRTPWHISFVWGIILTELKLRLKTPRSDASIEMFIVDSRHRGRGIGGMLIDRFLNAAREAGSSLVTVYSDDKMSNWQYYERRGFKRVGTFYDNITSQYSGSDAHGIIFALSLEEEV